ncbi:wd-repeat protein [Culex quinquefasciatus]|uniref:Wd-repeat protein n=1 Tax=Culex quinquefasciatus TaxID=7176 RepID=B0WC95_CULQU|nr:wd-repeat protein [Culex quinquefasciatus]|eukprot:XP_001846329.1 wd-repeat protein [Culex quinquefasciatus]
MEDDSGAGDGHQHPRPKKSRLSEDHDGMSSSDSIPATTAVEGSGGGGTAVAAEPVEEKSSSPNRGVIEATEGDTKMVDPESPINSVPIATPEQSPSTKMDLDVGSPSTEDGAASSSAAAASVIAEPSTDAPPESADSVPTGEVASNEVVDSSERSARTRNRFRGRSYRQRSDSSSSEQNEGRAEDGEQDPDVEAMIRRLVDEMNRENNDASEDDDEEDNNERDEDSMLSSTADSDDSDTSSPAVSIDDDDDDDSSDDNEEGSDNNANAPVDVSNLPFMQTANVKSTWDYFREIQLRSLGLSYRTKSSLGGVRYNSSQFQSRAYGSKHVVERLALAHRLRKHGGCVNSLNFNAAGTLLASGSDDLKINIWNWETGNRLAHNIASGHRSNVFQTKFVEASGYRSELELISTGRDGQVRHFRVGPAGDVKRAVLFKHSQPIHKIAIPARSPYEFLTACENGVVKGYDLRDNVAKKVTHTRKRLYSISTHPLDNEFCVSGSDESVLVYDRRNPARPAKSLYPVHMKNANKKEFFTVTCAVYNNTGTEILASYSDEDVYLFDNVHHEEGKYLHSNVKTIKGVNFFGPQSEFVVSGSDCGNIFFWDKQSEIIVNWLKGDDAGVVNCLEPHPEFPILATSGLDHDAKIWVPNGTDDEHEAPVFSREALEKCVRRNLRVRQNNRCTSFSENRILDFLMLSRPGIGGRLRRRFSSDSDGPAGGDGSGGGGENPDGDGSGRGDDDDNRMILRCNPS